jgi:hypothetical protein
MKAKILLLIILFGFVNCRAQKNKNTTIMDTPIITKDFEIFDIARYNRLKPNESKIASEITKDSSYVEMYKGEKDCYYIETAPNSYFSYQKVYYANGNIKQKGAYFNLSGNRGFTKGIWYEFDSSGKLSKENDYDKNFEFTFRNVLEFCKNENIKIETGPILPATGFHTMIRRMYIKATNKATWIIERLKSSDKTEEIILDGNTGNVISRTDHNYTNN